MKDLLKILLNKTYDNNATLYTDIKNYAELTFKDGWFLEQSGNMIKLAYYLNKLNYPKKPTTFLISIKKLIILKNKIRLKKLNNILSLNVDEKSKEILFVTKEK